MTNDSPENKPSNHSLKWSSKEFAALALALSVVLLWIGATVAFGYAGLISGALILVAASYCTLVLISRG